MKQIMGRKPIHKSEGSTDSERYLKKLCDRSFLSLWSYAGIHRDQGGGKEVCDLLVVFQNHIIIFSDKRCEFPNTGNLELDWRRWFREAIEESAQEIWGAERWIKAYPKRLFLDRACTQPFPLNLPDTSSTKFHRVIVAHGASERCRKEMGGSGSLMIDSLLVGPKHYTFTKDGSRPFVIGQVDPDKGYIHIFDDTTINIVMNTLDTITDFVTYLSKKEIFLTNREFDVFAAGEEELLALYLSKISEDGEHDFVLPNDIRTQKFRGVYVDEGFWNNFTQSPQRQAQIAANQISYAWDTLIETFNKYVLEGTQYYATDPEIRTQEKTVRFLAREPRTRRRMLAKVFIGLIKKTPASDRCTRTMLPSKPGDPHYVFLLLPHPKDVEYSKYREVRRDLLQRYCIITKLDFPDARDIIGIATETEADTDPDASFDTAYLDAKTWTDEEQIEARRLKQELIEQGRLGDKYVTTKWMERDYPRTYLPSNHVASEEPVYAMKGRDRNAPCPCGSGKKYKHCHGKINW